jgi:acetyltransferase-like isoleucine patch superfamily enzyme
MIFEYYWSKVLKKLRGRSILKSDIHKTSKVEAGSQVVNSIFDKHSFCGYDCDISNTQIGSFCSIANNVKIGGGIHPIDWASTSPAFYYGKDSIKAKFSSHERANVKNTYIGHDVWIGQDVLVSQGIKIGTGAVVGMGSIVTKDVEPYTVVAGNPAKLIKKRFDDEVTKKLIDSNWWLLPEDTLKKISIDIKNPIVFLERVKQEKINA